MTGTGQTGNAYSPEVVDRLARIEADVRHKPGLLQVFGTMCAAVAIPFGIMAVWFPMETNRLSNEIQAATTAAKEAAENSRAAADSSAAAQDRLDTLVVAIARSTSKKNLVAMLEGVRGILPQQTYVALSEKGYWSNVSYSNFDAQNWIFVPAETHLKIDADLAHDLENAVERAQWNIIIEGLPEDR